MKNKSNKIITKYILSLIGFFIIIIFIYITFIKEKLPKNIPINLNEYYFWLLVYICSIYLFVIKQRLYPNYIKNPFIQKIISYIAKPFIIFDSSIKYYTKIFPYYLKILYKIIPEMNKFSYADYILFIYLFQIIPRFILSLIFIYDVFWLHYIAIYYYFIILSISSLFYLYCKYSLEFAYEQFITYLEEKYDQIYIVQVFYDSYYYELPDDEYPTFTAPYHDRLVSLREYILIQYENQSNPANNWDYEGSPLANEELFVSYRKNNNKLNMKLTSDDYKILDQEFYVIMPLILILHTNLNIEKNSQKKAYIPIFRIIIYGIYLICWVYILYLSYNTVNDFSITLFILDIINYYNVNENMFTGIFDNYTIPQNMNKSDINLIVNKKLNYFNKIHLVKLILSMYILHLYNNKENYVNCKSKW